MLALFQRFYSCETFSQIPQPSSSGSKRKREPATPTWPSTKHLRASNGANALMSMAESLGTFNTTLANTFPPPPVAVAPTPVRRTNAIAMVLRLEKSWLTPTERVALIGFLKADQSTADVYLALTEADVRQEWVRIQLENLGVNVVPF